MDDSAGKKSLSRQRSRSAPPGATQSRSRWLGCASLVVWTSLSGCTPLGEYIHNGWKVGPNYRKPPAPVAPDWIDAADVRLRRESPNLSEWWTVFDDSTLTSLVHSAYEQNLTLREAGFRVLAARARLGVAIGNFFPQQQEALGSYQRTALSQAVANRQFIPDRYFDNWNMGFGLTWELDFWGRFRRAIEAADANLDARVEEYDDVIVTTLADVATYYTQIRVLEQQLAFTRANIALQEQTLSIAIAKFKGGNATELDVDQAKSILAQTQAIVPQLEISMRQANNSLCVLLGIPPENLKARLGAGDIPTAPPDVAVGIPAELLARRPDVRRVEREAAAESALIGIAVSDLYPHIAISGTLGYTSENFSDLFTSQAFRGTIGPAFQWKLLNYGRLVNEIRLREATFQEHVARYQNKVLQAGQEAENGIVSFLQAQVETRALKDSVDAAEKAVKVAIAQYEGGLVDFNRVSLIEQNLVQQQNSYVQAKGQIALGLIQIYRALGGGWEIRLEDRPTPVTEGGPAIEGESIPRAQPQPAPATDPVAPVPKPTPTNPKPASTSTPTKSQTTSK